MSARKFYVTSQTKKNSSLVSVCVVMHNDFSTIDACLSSLNSQKYKNFHVVIIDNDSKDGSLTIAQQTSFAVYRNSRNIGYPAAINQALLYAKGKYVITLNPDVILDSWYISHLVKTMELQPVSVGSASGLLLRINHVGDKSNIIDSSGLYMRRNRRQGLLSEHSYLSEASKKINMIFGPDGAAAFYRRTMLDNIALSSQEIFDNNFFMHKDDVDVAWRAQLRGWSSIHVPSAIAYHVRTFRAGQRQRVSFFFRALAVRNRYLLMIKNEIPRHFFADIFSILLYEIGIFIYILFREPSSLYGYISVVKLFPRMLKKRRVIQSKRTVDWQSMRKWFV